MESGRNLRKSSPRSRPIRQGPPNSNPPIILIPFQPIVMGKKIKGVTRDAKRGVGLHFIRWRSDSIKHGWLTRTDKHGQNLWVLFPVLELQMRFHQFFERHPLSESVRVSACLSDTCRTCFISKHKCNTPTFDNISWEVNVQNERNYMYSIPVQHHSYLHYTV
jgi:hypothetical protein